MKKFLAVIAAAFCILTVLNTAHTAGKDEAEKKEQVKICISMPVDIADALAEDFTKASGVETQVVPLPPGSAENRFNFLASSGSDVWLGGTAEEFYLAAERGLLVSYQPEEAYAIPAEFRQNNWLWTALYIDHIGFLICIIWGCMLRKAGKSFWQNRLSTSLHWQTLKAAAQAMA